MARYETVCLALAAMAGNSSNTVSVATAIESLVGNTVASSHVVVLIPDVSVALSPWDVGRMVVPLVRLNFIIFWVKMGEKYLPPRPQTLRQ